MLKATASVAYAGSTVVMSEGSVKRRFLLPSVEPESLSPPHVEHPASTALPASMTDKARPTVFFFIGKSSPFQFSSCHNAYDINNVPSKLQCIPQNALTYFQKLKRSDKLILCENSINVK
jgi:hypothetical protein